MKLNPEKAEFLTGTVKYLGMLVEGDTFSIADKKVATINNLPTPKNKKEITYYKKFIPTFSDLVKPL